MIARQQISIDRSRAIAAGILVAHGIAALASSVLPPTAFWTVLAGIGLSAWPWLRQAVGAGGPALDRLEWHGDGRIEGFGADGKKRALVLREWSPLGAAAIGLRLAWVGSDRAFPVICRDKGNAPGMRALRSNLRLRAPLEKSGAGRHR